LSFNFALKKRIFTLQCPFKLFTTAELHLLAPIPTLLKRQLQGKGLKILGGISDVVAGSRPAFQQLQRTR
jgi:hypothetical protein